jgi:hypothetical protein
MEINMKKTMLWLIAFAITFAFGIFAFGLFNLKSSIILETQNLDLLETPVSKITPIGEHQLEKPQEATSESNLPFFKSFKADEGYSGWFIAEDFKGMPEVWTILLDQDFVESNNKNFIWQAMVLTQHKDSTPNDDADFSSIWIKTENNKLSFKTRKYRNVEYQFSGTFFKNGKNFEQAEKVLKGTMQKFVKGRKVAEFTSEFAYYEPQCFH